MLFSIARELGMTVAQLSHSMPYSEVSKWVQFLGGAEKQDPGALLSFFSDFKQ